MTKQQLSDNCELLLWWSGGGDIYLYNENTKLWNKWDRDNTDWLLNPESKMVMEDNIFEERKAKALDKQ